MTDRIVRRVSIATLRSHPRQADLFGNLPIADFEALLDDMKRNGQRHPIEILQDGTIVCGHQRVRTALVLGWTEIDAVILDESDSEEILRRLIEDNLSRRQLGPVGIARIYKELKSSVRIDHAGDQNGDLRDRLAKRLAVRSGRTLDRYLRLLEAPREVQDAVEARTISRATAERVLELSPSARQQLEKRLKPGEDVAHVLAQVLGVSGEQDVNRARKEYRRLLLHLGQMLPVLTTYYKQVAGYGLSSDEAHAVLECACKLFGKLAALERKTTRKSVGSVGRKARMPAITPKVR